MNRMQEDLQDLGRRLWPTDEVLRPAGRAPDAPPTRQLRSLLLAAALGGGTVALFAGALTLGLILRHAQPGGTPTSGGSPRPSPPASVTSPSPSVPQGPAESLRIVEQVSLGVSDASALAVQGGTVWVATPGAVYGDMGRLLRIDAQSGRVSATWAIGGDPVAVAAVGHYVWVASGFGDGSRVLPEQNTVMQFDTTSGAQLSTYQVTDPRGLVADGDSAIVVSSRTANGPTEVRVLAAGRSSVVAAVPGNLQGGFSPGQTALATCASETYLAISDVGAHGSSSVTLYATPSTGGALRAIATLPGQFDVNLTCNSTALFVSAAGGAPPGILPLNLADGRVRPLWPAAYPWAVSSAWNRVWVVYGVQSPPTRVQQAYLTGLDPTTGNETTTHLTLPTTGYNPYLLVPDASTLWVVAGSGNTLFRVAVG